MHNSVKVICQTDLGKCSQHPPWKHQCIMFTLQLGRKLLTNVYGCLHKRVIEKAAMKKTFKTQVLAYFGEVVFKRFTH